MGLDVSFGVMFGLPISDIGEFESGLKWVTRYNERTGEPHQQQIYDESYVLKTDFGKWHTGDRVSDQDLRDFFDELVQSDGHTRQDRKGLHWVYSNNYFGVKAFVGDEPYYPPQDMCFELVTAWADTEMKWRSVFPGLPGKQMMYLHASY